MPRRQEKPSAPNPAQANFEDVLFPEGQRANLSASSKEGEPPENLVRESLPTTPATVPEHLPIFGVKLVRVGSVSIGERPRMNRPGEVAAMLWD